MCVQQIERERKKKHTQIMTVRTKNLTEVYSLYKEHLFQEQPFIHTILFEHYCVFSGQGADQYRQSATKWLKDTKSADRYIEGFIKRFPKLPRQCRRVALNCMYVALCVSESITTEVFCDLESILTNFRSMEMHKEKASMI